MKITHWGEDYATLKVGTKEFEISIELAEAIERYIKKLTWNAIKGK